MRIKLFFLPALLTLWPLPGVTGEWPAEVIETLDQARIVLFIRDEDIASIPEWRPGDGPLPLSLEQVVSILLKEMEKSPDLRGGKIYEIEFKPVRRHEKQHRWYFLAEIRTHGDSGMKKHFLAVLTSGKVLRAVVEPSL